MQALFNDAEKIYKKAIAASRPTAAVTKALEGFSLPAGQLVVIAVGKAAWEMAEAAQSALGCRISRGVIVTKYGHSRGPLDPFRIVEAGHPLPDENSFKGARAAVEAVSGLSAEDCVLFLLSGGGSALFELSTLPLEELEDINRQLLASGAGIEEINTIRKRLSLVKAGRFAELCRPARVISLLLSDVLGDRADMIASGPTCPDSASCAEALEIAEKYSLKLSPAARQALERETPKRLENAEHYICGGVSLLCRAAEDECRRLGYETLFLTDSLSCEAREAGRFLAAIARSHCGEGRRLAFIAGGETVVHLRGRGLGGRNQELALAAAEGIAGLENAAVFSVGSDGTDGPTDAAGGFVHGGTAAALEAEGIKISAVLEENDSYHALERCGGLIKTGPTGTNVNDLSVVLVG